MRRGSEQMQYQRAFSVCFSRPLGAGAARGFAHIGLLKVLEANKIPVHMIVSTSAGSFVGSLYAYGFNTFQLQKMSFDLRKDDILDLTVPENGFIKGEKLAGYI
jgi:NTE family protein